MALVYYEDEVAEMVKKAKDEGYNQCLDDWEEFDQETYDKFLNINKQFKKQVNG